LNAFSEFTVYSNNLPDSGVYTIIVTAELSGVKYNVPSINKNTALTFGITIVDPCATAVVNDFADTTYNRVILNMVTSVLGPSDSQ